jgi:poly(A) polymerase
MSLEEANAGRKAAMVPFVLTRSEHTLSRRHIDPDALKILFRLRNLGFTAYLTGGAVRDMLLGKTPKDFDIATSAHPAQIKKCFANAFIIGRRFRLAHIRFRGGKVIEVATFRKDPGPAAAPARPGAAPLPYAFGTPAEDAWRRDITVNALFYDPATAEVIDYVGGVGDLRQGRIRIIGDAAERFREDPVRIWRVIRYAARLGFQIGAEVGDEILASRHLLAGCSDARLFEEFSKDMLGPQTRSVVEGLREFGALRLLLGRIGFAYESDPGLFARVCALLDIAEREKALHREPGLGEMSVLFFWPWVESLLAGTPTDPATILRKEFMEADLAVALPKSLRAQAIDVMVLLNRMLRGLRTGNMRWSLRGRPQYAQASRLYFLVELQRAPEAGESFETVFQKAFPARPLRESGRPRRRRRKKKPALQ